MSEGFKGFGWVLLTISGLIVVMCFTGLSNGGYLLYLGIFGIITSIPLFIASGIVKIMEQQRDALYRIEELLEKDKSEE